MKATTEQQELIAQVTGRLNSMLHAEDLDKDGRELVLTLLCIAHFESEAPEDATVRDVRLAFNDFVDTMRGAILKININTR